MKLDALFPAERVFRLRAPHKQAALAELSQRAALAAGIAAAEIGSALEAREGLGSTGVGGGLAVPHARLPGLSEVTGFFARLDRAVEWGAIDGKPVDLVFLLLSPATAHADHLVALAAGTRRLRDAAAARAIRSVPAAALHTALVGGTGEPDRRVPAV